MSLSLIPRRSLNRLLDMPLSSFPSLWGDFDEEFRELVKNPMGEMTIFEDQNNTLHVEVPMPGLKGDEIEVNLNKNILYIKGQQKQEEGDKSKRFYKRTERSYSLQLPLPIQVDDKQEPKAAYEDGIVKITFTKAKQEESKRIPVKTTKSKT